MRQIVIIAAIAASAAPVSATVAWGGPGWHVMAFDEGGWRTWPAGPYGSLRQCRSMEAEMKASNKDPELGFDCVYLPTAPIPDTYSPSMYVTLPAGASVDDE